MLRPTRSFLLSAPFALACDFAAPNSLLVLNLPGALPHQNVALGKWDVKGLVQNSPCETLWGINLVHPHVHVLGHKDMALE